MAALSRPVGRTDGCAGGRTDYPRHNSCSLRATSRTGDGGSGREDGVGHVPFPKVKKGRQRTKWSE